jgi:hypothetical protein
VRVGGSSSTLQDGQERNEGLREGTCVTWVEPLDVPFHASTASSDWKIKEHRVQIVMDKRTAALKEVLAIGPRTALAE